VVPQAPQVAEVLPLLYLHGLSTGDFAPALAAFFGSARGLSASAIGRLLGAWQADDQAFCRRDLAERDAGDLWADGRHFRVRWEQAHRCCLVLVGVRADGTKERVAVADGERESTASWAELLGICVAAGWVRRWWRPATARWAGAALRDVFPATRQQRDWVHKLANVLTALPTSVQAGARKALAEIRDAPDRDHAERAIELVAGEDGVKWPRRWPRSPTTPKRWGASSTSRPSIGCT
jgi:putative transposase